MNIKKEYKGKNIHKKGRTIRVDDIKSSAEAKRLGVEFILDKESGSKKKTTKKKPVETEEPESTPKENTEDAL